MQGGGDTGAFKQSKNKEGGRLTGGRLTVKTLFPTDVSCCILRAPKKSADKRRVAKKKPQEKTFSLPPDFAVKKTRRSGGRAVFFGGGRGQTKLSLVHTCFGQGEREKGSACRGDPTTLL